MCRRVEANSIWLRIGLKRQRQRIDKCYETNDRQRKNENIAARQRRVRATSHSQSRCLNGTRDERIRRIHTANTEGGGEETIMRQIHCHSFSFAIRHFFFK